MPLAAQIWRAGLGKTGWICRPCLLKTNHKRFYHADDTYKESDIVLLRPVNDPSATPILTKPLSKDVKIQTHRGAVRHEDIIGKRVRDVVQSSSNSGFRIHDVSLAEYVRLSKRLVTPIYPSDANLIVSLFDIHVSPPSDATRTVPTLEILEAGTGHGALTLHLSRAIHAANPPKPLDLEHPAISTTGDVDAAATSIAFSSEGIEMSSLSGLIASERFAQWKNERRAIIHTIDISAKFSKHAAKVVRGFRNGIYASNVDFHVGDVSEWTKAQQLHRASLSGSDEAAPFLMHAFLDLPSTHDHLSTVASALHVNGTLVVFNPSITQIAECVKQVKQNALPLFLDQVLELGNNGTSGGKEWDVRAVVPRAVAERLQSKGSPDGENLGAKVDTDGRGDATLDALVETPVVPEPPKDLTLVCRPKVGGMIVGGGFLGVFKKTRQDQPKSSENQSDLVNTAQEE